MTYDKEDASHQRKLDCRVQIDWKVNAEIVSISKRFLDHHVHSAPLFRDFSDDDAFRSDYIEFDVSAHAARKNWSDEAQNFLVLRVLNRENGARPVCDLADFANDVSARCYI
jgi:hypothetical protein